MKAYGVRARLAALPLAACDDSASSGDGLVASAECPRPGRFDPFATLSVTSAICAKKSYRVVFERRSNRRPCPRQGTRAEFGATVQADAASAAGSHQAARPQGEETLTEIGRSYNVSAQTISRLAV